MTEMRKEFEIQRVEIGWTKTHITAESALREELSIILDRESWGAIPVPGQIITLAVIDSPAAEKGDA